MELFANMHFFHLNVPNLSITNKIHFQHRQLIDITFYKEKAILHIGYSLQETTRLYST